MRALLGLTMMMVTASAAIAQDAQDKPGLRLGDRLFPAEELSELLSGQAVTFYDGGTARFASDGGYTYVYEGSDQIWAGTWATTTESAVCVAFDNGFSRCDTYIDDGVRRVLITDKGDRFPAKSRAPL